MKPLSEVNSCLFIKICSLILQLSGSGREMKQRGANIVRIYLSFLNVHLIADLMQ